MINPLQTDIKYLKGVGPLRAKTLGEDLGIFTLRDMLYNFPYKYIDRSVIHKIKDLTEGMPYVLLKGQVIAKNIEGTGRHERLVAIFSDGTGYVELVWFNSIKSIERKLQFNKSYILLGKPSSFNRRINIAHPELEDAKVAQEQPLTMQPHYHTSERMKRQGFSSRTMSELVQRAFDMLQNQPVSETLPPYLIAQYHLMGVDKALRTVHHPPSSAALPEASRRLKFEELFYLQLDILRYTQNRKLHYNGFVFPKVGNMFMRFFNEQMPFELTNAQKRVIREIRNDVATGSQMNRLLQGDVGSGKTMVALLCSLLAIDNHFQACIMAPTEILAEQHYLSICNYLGSLPIKVELLTGNVKGKRRKEILEGIANGSIHLLVGTHALIEPSVVFHNLGFVVIDEQHRFGVKQRAKLWEKNVCPPHILVMTATPIPRTLAMTVYGDLDVSVIDELPPGRKPIQTVHYRQSDRYKLYQGMRYQLQLGRQIYVVYPLIKENEKLDLHDLQTGYNQLVDIFKEYHVGMVHGKMKPAEKEQAMADFKEQRTQILVSTTVIEVGVNVPNASVMVIENAERFGLAQLHQLRGRVGRGAEQSYCVLMTKDKIAEASLRRMQVMVDSTDGFVIAEEDMKLRGPGDLEGTAQSGMPFDLKIANIVKDQNLLELAREAASEVLANDPQQKLPQNEVIWSQLALLKKTKINFSAIS
ncbi:MAG: ATP-dependent DNA helicase RecG [Prevotella sp.]|nr:ATP-dependent DNA helicase RecG [Prevotella sp.]MDY5666095.1 ATP-dependent DNA helicase RecG [Alloprevotella sp.]